MMRYRPTTVPVVGASHTVNRASITKVGRTVIGALSRKSTCPQRYRIGDKPR